ncbi:hypothetical protein Micr_00443 [Candidatus Micrarchaeum sp.]|jgi:hypothetical protein|uniref:hypothetical protein n=1 Tax=Candidatus Micrarchaeum sp. TaxID=2282148 RepID=UPI00092AB111|nr:hypothetical protein [Candidatus Micrarchaeum sp.]OJT94145.1 MAG: hypothetical protein JJ59_04170 [Candidatus Micrarchaeum sp. AZ1]OWP53328.1 MAG: hypothetical protein B2I19_02585 [Thermoplasmatales archaeon ARMAN]QRF73915.1 hypothetical protein Micr_00443 [Candidatus Micrarchaeum sp.]
MDENGISTKSEYEQVVVYIKGIEASTQKPQQSSINVSKLFETNENSNSHTYLDLLSRIDSIESNRGGQRIRSQKTMPKESQLIASGVEQSSRASAVPTAAQQSFEVPESRPQPKIKVKFNEKDLVLPKLSIADQISELERIIEGLKEQVFDENHKEVVLQEIYGLSAYIERSSKDLRKRKITLNQTEQSLWALRQQRLDEAMGLINAGA